MDRRLTPPTQGVRALAEALEPARVDRRFAVSSRREARPRTRLLTGVLVAGLGGFGALADKIGRGEVDRLDEEMTARLQAVQNPCLDRAMRFVSWFGFPPQGRLLPLAYATILWVGRYPLEAVFQLIAWGTAPLSSLIKSLARRPRPAGNGLRVIAAPLDGSSFPSGHVLTYVGVYGWMAIMANRLIKRPLLRRLAVGSTTALIAAVGPSRVYLGHHRPSDVAASYLLGASYLAAMVVAYRRLRGQGASR